MSTDFWAGYLSGALGIVVGNPLDLIKVRLQAQNGIVSPGDLRASVALTTGTAAPLLGYGALNALLFMTYNRSRDSLNRAFSIQQSLTSTWLAGALGGLATWVISTPTELVKCQAQAAKSPLSSIEIAKSIWVNSSVKGFYQGGTITALRDSIGYGFYFWSYELAMNMWPSDNQNENHSHWLEASRILTSGGIAGVATWVSVFPLDVIKTRVQIQDLYRSKEITTFGHTNHQIYNAKRAGAWQVTKSLYTNHGVKVFFRGLGVCCARAFIVNAIQWGAYEGIMRTFHQPPNVESLEALP